MGLFIKQTPARVMVGDDEFCLNLSDFVMEHQLHSLPRIVMSGSVMELISGKGGKVRMPEIEKVVYSDPATVIYWKDKTRTVVKCQKGDVFDPELGFLLAVCKKAFGNTGRYNELLKQHVPGYGEKEVPEDGHE